MRKRRPTSTTDVWTYFQQRERECEEASLSASNLVFAEEEGSRGRRGRVVGHVYFGEEVYLEVNELVEVRGSAVHRKEYAYFLIIEGEEVWGFERDPTHDPPVHAHGPGHERLGATPIPFKEVLARAWREVSLRAEPWPRS